MPIALTWSKPPVFQRFMYRKLYNFYHFQPIVIVKVLEGAFINLTVAFIKNDVFPSHPIVIVLYTPRVTPRHKRGEDPCGQELFALLSYCGHCVGPVCWCMVCLRGKAWPPSADPSFTQTGYSPESRLNTLMDLVWQSYKRQDTRGTKLPSHIKKMKWRFLVGLWLIYLKIPCPLFASRFVPWTTDQWIFHKGLVMKDSSRDVTSAIVITHLDPSTNTL